MNERAMVENNGFEPMLTVCNAVVLPLTLIPQERTFSVGKVSAKTEKMDE